MTCVEFAQADEWLDPTRPEAGARAFRRLSWSNGSLLPRRRRFGRLILVAIAVGARGSRGTARGQRS